MVFLTTLLLSILKRSCCSSSLVGSLYTPTFWNSFVQFTEVFFQHPNHFLAQCKQTKPWRLWKRAGKVVLIRRFLTPGYNSLSGPKISKFTFASRNCWPGPRPKHFSQFCLCLTEQWPPPVCPYLFLKKISVSPDRRNGNSQCSPDWPQAHRDLPTLSFIMNGCLLHIWF